MGAFRCIVTRYPSGVRNRIRWRSPDWVIAQLVRQNRLENRTSCKSCSPDFHVSGTFERHVTRYDWSMYRAIGRLRAGESYRVAAPLPKCRLLCEVDYESMPYFPIFRCSLWLVIFHSVKHVEYAKTAIKAKYCWYGSPEQCHWYFIGGSFLPSLFLWSSLHVNYVCWCKFFVLVKYSKQSVLGLTHG